MKFVEWILERLPVVIFVVIFVSQIVRAVLRSRKARAEHESQHDETAEERRTREIQEQIRRRIAERRGETVAPPPLMPEAAEPPVARPQTTQLPELFGGPLGRMLEDLQKRAQPAPPPPPVVVETRNAEFERQQQLADQIQALEQQRALVQRRASQLAAEKRADSQKEGALLSASRGLVLGDLRDPQSLKRAIVMREVLGPPVALR
jgi:hypothetical protein